jgi:hypothetical protein
MNLLSRLIRPAFAATLLSCTFLVVNAQKLPAKQEVSLMAPANLKIDGKATEWPEQLHAYNGNTEVFYSIANDAEKLYLVIQADKPVIIKKIISQAITFTVNNAAKKDFKNAVSVTYPLLHNNTGTILNGLKKGSAINDSTINAMNSQLVDKAKEIKVIGVPATADSVISVYNDQGIKAAALFNSQKYYTYELAIPLKLLGLSANSANKFTYNIKLNGVSAYGVNASITPDGKAIRMGDRSKGEMITVLALPPDALAAYFPTDFWGEYTLK